VAKKNKRITPGLFAVDGYGDWALDSLSKQDLKATVFVTDRN